MNRLLRKAAIPLAAAAAFSPALAGCGESSTPPDAIRNNIAAERSLGELSGRFLGSMAVKDADVAPYSTNVQPPYRNTGDWWHSQYAISESKTGDTCQVSFTARRDAQGNLGGWVSGNIDRPGITEYTVSGADQTLKVETPVGGTPSLTVNGQEYVATPHGNEAQLTDSVIADANRVGNSVLQLCGAAAPTSK
jgi:hypothetical protein